MSGTDNSCVLQANDLQPNIFTTIARVDEQRQRRDILYRLLTNADPTELNEHVLGLISDGSNGMAPGLLFRKYTPFMNQELKAVLQKLQGDIVDSDIKCNGSGHRILCHMLIFAALALESEFVNYVVLHSHNRQRLSKFIDGMLRDTMHKLLSGGLMKTSWASNVHMFTHKLYALYMMCCTP